MRENSEPFLPIALAPAMRRHWDLSFDAPLSADLLANSKRIQQVLQDWYPDFASVQIDADTEDRRPAPGDGVALFFSGGLDSFYSLYKHKEEVTHLVFLHGFDLPLRWREMRMLAAQRARRVAAALGLELIEVSTNLRSFAQPHVSWPLTYHGSALAAVSLMLSPRFKRVYIAAAYNSEEESRGGSHSELDYLWSNGAIEPVLDGMEATRFEKVEAIHDWPLFRENLRVCYQNSAPALNCGRCVKCCWMQMILRALGDEAAFTTFQRPLSLRRLKHFPPYSEPVRRRFQQCLDASRLRGGDPEFERALEALTAKAGQPPPAARLIRFRYRLSNYLAHRIPGGTL